MRLFIAAIALTSSFMACAGEQESIEQTCARHQKVAEIVVTARYSNVPRFMLIQNVNGDKIALDIIDKGYKLNYFIDEVHQKMSAKEFGKEIYDGCINDL